MTIRITGVAVITAVPRVTRDSNKKNIKKYRNWLKKHKPWYIMIVLSRESIIIIALSSYDKFCYSTRDLK